MITYLCNINLSTTIRQMGYSKDQFNEIRERQELDAAAIQRGRDAVINTGGAWQALAMERLARIKSLEAQLSQVSVDLDLVNAQKADLEQKYYEERVNCHRARRDSTRETQIIANQRAAVIENVLIDTFNYTTDELWQIDERAERDA